MAPTVLIAGAGPTGLTAAVELARRGVVPLVCERRDGPSPLSRAVGILPSSIAILSRSETDEPILDEAIRFAGIVFHHGRDPVGHFPLNFDSATRIWGLPQDRTEHHLRESLRRYGGEVRYSASVELLGQDSGGVEVRIGQEERRVDYLIGADGTRSAVRHGLGLGYPGYDLPETWSIADVDSENWPWPEDFHGFLLGGRDVAVVVPMAPRRYRVIASREDALKALPVEMKPDSIRRADSFTIAVRQAESYGHGRVFLAGDAAHSHSPVGGRGMNVGIADAAALARRIAAGRLEGYEAERRPAGAHAIALSEQGRRMIQGDEAWRRRALLTGLRTASAVPLLGRALMRRFVSG